MPYKSNWIYKVTEGKYKGCFAVIYQDGVKDMHAICRVAATRKELTDEAPLQEIHAEHLKLVKITIEKND